MIWVVISTLRRSNRSAITPATGARSSTGANCRPVTIPTATPELSVSWVRTSQSWAMRCIQVPVFDTRAPVTHKR